MSAFQQYNIYPCLTPVRVAATSNQSGTYNNGPSNNGVGATFTYATGVLTIDSVTVNAGDRVLFSAQSSANQNGIYVCTVTGAVGVAAVLQRAADQQSIEQLLKGQFATIAAGSVNGGGGFVLVEPLPAQLGVSNMTWLSQMAVGTVSFSGPASTANALAVFADTAGDLKAASTATTLGFGLTIQTGNLAVTAGNVTAGSSGNAGFFTSFPAAASNGSFVFKAVNNSNNFASTLSNSAVGQATTYTLPDPAGATAQVAVAPAALVSGNLISASGTAGLIQDSGIVAANLQINTVTVSMSQSQVQGAFATPVQIVAAPGAGKVIVPVQMSLYTNFQTSAFAGGGVAILQYGNTIHGAGNNSLAATIPAAEITAAASQVYNLGANTANALTGDSNAGIFFSNATGAFTGGNAASTVVVTLSYYVITATI